MRLVEALVPRPGPGQVLVRVTAAGVNFSDTMRYPRHLPARASAPHLAGTETVGHIAALGAGVDGWQVGDRVLGEGSGAFAAYVTMLAAVLLPVPKGWTDTQTVGLLTNWLTAYAALRTFGGLRDGDTGAGARSRRGRRVDRCVVGGPRALRRPGHRRDIDRHQGDVARATGADDVIDYGEYDVAEHALALTDGRGVDLILDGVGGEVFQASLRGRTGRPGDRLRHGGRRRVRDQPGAALRGQRFQPRP